MRITENQFQEIVLHGQKLIVFVVATAGFLRDRRMGLEIVAKAEDIIKRRDVVEGEKSIDDVMILIGEMLEFNTETIKFFQSNGIGARIIPRLQMIDQYANKIVADLYRGVNVTEVGFKDPTAATLFKAYPDLRPTLELR